MVVLIRWEYLGKYYEETREHKDIIEAKVEFKKRNAGNLKKVTRSKRKPGYYKQIYYC
jgi:hypothetical protein